MHGALFLPIQVLSDFTTCPCIGTCIGSDELSEEKMQHTMSLEVKDKPKEQSTSSEYIELHQQGRRQVGAEAPPNLGICI